MKVLFESDRECTIDGVGLLEPGVPVEVDPAQFENYHGVQPLKAVLPSWVKVWVETDVQKVSKSKKSEGGE